MRYMLLPRADQEALLAGLSAMPTFLDAAFGGLSAADAKVEQCWHLADLERDGYAVRIRRLLSEAEPALPDFDGERVAQERNYKSLSLADGLESFRRTRAENLAALRALTESEWERRGTQEGVGRVGLCDIPPMMAEHDAAHRAEIDEWMSGQGSKVKGQRSKGKGQK
jgi:hypothetical protein